MITIIIQLLLTITINAIATTNTNILNNISNISRNTNKTEARKRRPHLAGYQHTAEGDDAQHDDRQPACSISSHDISHPPAHFPILAMLGFARLHRLNERHFPRTGVDYYVADGDYRERH